MCVQQRIYVTSQDVTPQEQWPRASSVIPGCSDHLGLLHEPVSSSLSHSLSQDTRETTNQSLPLMAHKSRLQTQSGERIMVKRCSECLPTIWAPHRSQIMNNHGRMISPTWNQLWIKNPHLFEINWLQDFSDARAGLLCSNIRQSLWNLAPPPPF